MPSPPSAADREGDPSVGAETPEPASAQERTIGGRDLTEWRSAAGRRLVAVVAAVSAALAGLLRWSRANLALVVTVLVGGVLFLVLEALAAEVYEAVVERDGLQALDQPVLDAAVRLRTPARDAAVTAFTDLGSTVGMTSIVVVCTVTLALVRRSWTPVVLASVAAAGSVLMTVLGKDLVGRTRPPSTLAVPPLESSPSFPSGHTLNATVLIGVLAYLVLLGMTRLWMRVLVGTVAVLFVLAMGLSRVYLGHHWLTDVVAGWLLGLGWLVAVVTAHRVQLTLRDRDPETGRTGPSS
jgi:undecaprenyl-diphosphatase